MERASFILSSGFMIMVGLYALNMTRADVDVSDRSERYGHRIEARQIALAGLSIAINNLRTNVSYSGTGLHPTSIMGGAVSISVDSQGLQTDQRRVVSTGQYFSETDTVTAVVQLDPPTSNMALFALLNHQGPIEMQGSNFSIPSSSYKKFFITGIDTVGGYGTAYGIGTRSTLSPTTVSNAIINRGARDSVVGSGANPSVTQLSSTADLTSIRNEVRKAATIVHRSGTLGRPKAWGTVDRPEIVFVTRSLTIDRSLTGAGILCVDGTLNVRSTMNWQGYVIVYDRTFYTTGTTSSTRIDGAVFFGKGGTGTLNFGSLTAMRITYNRAILNTLNVTLLNTTFGKPSLVRIHD